MENKETPRDSQWNKENDDAQKHEPRQPLEGPLADDATPIDLDGDGMIGNTGGFYGGTSYVGSNYGADWNADDNSQHEGNYGAAGQQDATDLTEDRLRKENEEREERIQRGE